ncbi:MAG: phosphate propanoyltransferase [Patescibacteria group bacterium]
MPKPKIKVEVSARHIHLSQEHLAKLFGKNYQLTKVKNISQPGQFAAKEKVVIAGPKVKLSVRIIGPTRPQTQVELSATDCWNLGIKPVLRLSANLKNTPGCFILGPRGRINLKQGVIVAQRHLHLTPAEAKLWRLKHGDVISLRTVGTRSITFHQVAVRSRAGIDKMSFMLDIDEANAAGVKRGECAEII